MRGQGAGEARQLDGNLSSRPIALKKKRKKRKNEPEKMVKKRVTRQANTLARWAPAPGSQRTAESPGGGEGTRVSHVPLCLALR